MLQNRSALESALLDKSWAVTGVLLGMDHIRDTNGRPLGERRAPAAARLDVPMELVKCPYHDERHGRLMNRSALGPTIRELPAVAAQVAAFVAALPAGEPSWERMLIAVVDQLAGPARYLLHARRELGPVPTLASAGHKLAAGYFGALMVLHRELLAGQSLPPATGEGFDGFVRERGALLGASEVCAGPPSSIATLTRLFVHGGPAERPAHERAPELEIPVARVDVARVVAAQIRAGIAWQLLDEAIERDLLLDAQTAGTLKPRTKYLAERIATRVAELRDVPSVPVAALAARLPEAREDPELARALATPEIPIASAAQVRIVADLLEAGDVAIELDVPTRAAYAVRLADLLCRYQLFTQAQARLERGARRALGYSSEPGLKLNTLLVPNPRALAWLEIFLGHRLQCVAGESTELVIRNHHRVVPFALRSGIAQRA